MDSRRLRFSVCVRFCSASWITLGLAAVPRLFQVDVVVGLRERPATRGLEPFSSRSRTHGHAAVVGAPDRTRVESGSVNSLRVMSRTASPRRRGEISRQVP